MSLARYSVWQVGWTHLVSARGKPLMFRSFVSFNWSRVKPWGHWDA